MPRSFATTLSDPAAEHARALLRPFDLDVDIPDRDDAAPAAREWASSGAMQLTGPPDAAPRFAAGPLASAARGAGLALRALAPRTELDALDAPALLGERAALEGLERRGAVSAGGAAHLLSTADDPIVLNLPRDEDWQLVPAWLEADDAAFAAARDWKRLSEWVGQRATEPLVERGRMMGLAVARAVRSIPADRAAARLALASEVAPRRDVHRLRLLDLSHLWAGPLATSLLSMAGVDVLKLESPARPDGARRGGLPFFHLLNAGKRGVALDLRRSNDRIRFEALLDRADVVVESARPRALAQLGFDAESWVTASPGRLWASITGYGRRREWIAFGDDAAVAAGLAWSPDASDRDACFCADAIADPLAGLHAAVWILAHLRSGRGGLLDLSLVDIAAHAATAPHDGLVLPIDRRQGHWHVLEDDRATRVANPRARAPRGEAPAPEGSDDAAIEAWLAAC